MESLRPFGSAFAVLSLTLVSACSTSGEVGAVRPAGVTPATIAATPTITPPPTPAPTPTGTPTPTVTPVTPVSGFVCPDEPSTEVTVIGRADPLPVRTGPAQLAEEIAGIAVATATRVFPQTLQTGLTDIWWAQVELPGSDRCGFVAAMFLGYGGATIEQPFPGITIEAPSLMSWRLWPRLGRGGPAQWALVDSAGTTLSIQVRDGLLLDAIVEDRRAIYHGLDAEVEPGWKVEHVVPGADRAVLLTDTIGALSGSYVRTVLAEVGGFTIEAQSVLFEVDIGAAPFEVMDRFIESIEIDAPRFVAAMDAG